MNALGVSNGTEDWLFVVPTDRADLEVVLPAEVPRGGRNDTPVLPDRFKPAATHENRANRLMLKHLTARVVAGALTQP